MNSAAWQEQEPARRVLLIGGFGWRDIGDEAMPQAVIHNLRQSVPGIQIVMLSPNPEYTAQYHGVKAVEDLTAFTASIPRPLRYLCSRRLGILGTVCRHAVERVLHPIKWLWFWVAAMLMRRNISIPLGKTARTVLEELAKTDLVFNNGGGNINSLLRVELHKQTMMHMAAHALGKPVILSGQTLGPFNNKFDSWLAGIALNRVHMITLRDSQVSRQRAAAIGVNRPRMLDTGDDAIALEALSRSQSISLLRQSSGPDWGHENRKLLVAINLNGYLLGMGKARIEDFEHEIALAAMVADRVHEEFGGRIVFIPTGYGSHSDDRPLLRMAQQRMKRPEAAVVICQEYNATQLKGLVALCDLAIGSRYHFAVFALSSGVPGVFYANGEYQKTKLQGVAQLFLEPNLFLDTDSSALTSEDLWRRIISVVGERRLIQERLVVMTTKLKSRVLVSVHESAKLLIPTQPLQSTEIERGF